MPQCATVTRGGMPILLREPRWRRAELVLPPLRVAVARTAGRATGVRRRCNRGGRLDPAGNSVGAAGHPSTVVLRGVLPLVLPQSVVQRWRKGRVSRAGR